MKLKWIIGGAGLVFFLAAWAGVAAGILLDVDTEIFVVLVTVAAIASEALFWCAAAVLGLTVVEARRRFRHKLTSLFARPKHKQQQ